MVYCIPAASGDHGQGNAPSCRQCRQCTVLGNHHTPDRHRHDLKTSQQTHPKQKRLMFAYQQNCLKTSGMCYMLT